MKVPLRTGVGNPRGASALLVHHSSTLLPSSTTVTASLHLLSPHHRQKTTSSLLTSREELPSLLVSLYKQWLSLLQKQATSWGWSAEDKPVLASLARISRVHASGEVGVHCNLFPVQRKRDLSGWQSSQLCGQCILASKYPDCCCGLLRPLPES